MLRANNLLETNKQEVGDAHMSQVKMSKEGGKSVQDQQISQHVGQHFPPEEKDSLPACSGVSRQPHASSLTVLKSSVVLPGMLEVDITQNPDLGAVVSKDETTVTIHNANLCSHPDALVQFINA
jgi:hypothetical protein